MKLPALCVVAFLSLEFAESRFNYDGYKVYHVYPTTREQADLVKEFENDLNFDFWTDIRLLNASVDIMVSPAAQQKFETVMNREDIRYSTMIENVEEIVQAEDERQRRSPRVTRGEVSFTEFMRHEDIQAYLERIALEYPAIARTEVIGKSFEGRNLTVLRISSGGSDKPIIFAEAAIHAREWIAPPVALYIINQLVENPANADMYRDVEWIILPVVNPDGYEYTHTEERFWRKTRTPGTICYGIDGNRNFDFNWMLTGASSWQCAETHAGRAPFSEPESRALGNFLLANKGNIKLFLSLHSYGTLLMYPFGHTTDPPEDVEELRYIGERVKNAILDVRGTDFNLGGANEILYATSGGSRDFAKAVAGANLSFTFELPRGGSGGFNPEATEIVPVVTEIWEGIKIFHEYVQERYVN